jgi:hypothetical protein
MGDMGPYNDGSEDAFFNDRNEKRLKTRIEQLEAERGTLRGMYNVATQRNRQLEALLTEAADDISEGVKLRCADRFKYDDEMWKFNRDMDLPNRIRAALNPKEST